MISYPSRIPLSYYAKYNCLISLYVGISYRGGDMTRNMLLYRKEVRNSLHTHQPCIKAQTHTRDQTVWCLSSSARKEGGKGGSRRRMKADAEQYQLRTTAARELDRAHRERKNTAGKGQRPKESSLERSWKQNWMKLYWGWQTKERLEDRGGVWGGGAEIFVHLDH